MPDEVDAVLEHWWRRGVSDDVLWEQMCWCNRQCRKYPWLEHKRKFWPMLLRKLRKWENEQKRKLFQCCEPHQILGSAIGMGYRWVIEDETRNPKSRRPEPSGFVMDHPGGWWRF